MSKIFKYLIASMAAILLCDVANAQFCANGYDDMTVESCETTSSAIEPACNTSAIVSYLSAHPGGSIDLFQFLNGTFMPGATPGPINDASYEDTPVTKGFCESTFTRVYTLKRLYDETLVIFTHTVNYTIDHKYNGPGSVDTYYTDYDEIITGEGINSLPSFDADDAKAYILEAGWTSKVPCGRYDRLIAQSEDVFDSEQGSYMVFKRTISFFDACSSLDVCKVEVTYKMGMAMKVAGSIKNVYYSGDIFDKPEAYTTVQELIDNGLNITYPKDQLSSLTVESSDHWDSGGKYWERTYTITNPYFGDDSDNKDFDIRQDLILIPNFGRQFEVETEPVKSADPDNPDGKIWLKFSSYDMGAETFPEDPRYWYKIRLTNVKDNKVEEFENLYDNEYEKVVVDGGNIKDHYWKVLVKDDCEDKLYNLEVLTCDRTAHLSPSGSAGILTDRVVFKSDADVGSDGMKVYVSMEASSDGLYYTDGKEYVLGRLVHYMHLRGDGTFVSSGTCDELSYDNIWKKHNSEGACGFQFDDSWHYDFSVMQGTRLFEYQGSSQRWIKQALDRWQGFGYVLAGDDADLILVELKAGVKGTVIAEANGLDEEGNERTMKSKPKYVYHGVVACSDDPNNISGPVGYGDDKMIAATDRMEYRIDFENDTTATASAGRVVVRCPLHHRADSTAIRLGHFGFGDFAFSVPELAAFYDNRITETEDSLGVWVDVTAGLDIDNNEMYWIFQSIDPETGVAPIDTTGFLPVNDTVTGRGEGYVTFSVAALANTVTGDTIAEQATITFDENDPMETNVYVNKFDAVAPTSQMWCDTLGVHDDYTLKFKALATDDTNGSGVNQVYLYANVDKTQYVFAGVLSKDEEHNDDTLRYNYKLGQGSLYWFAAQAIDNVGNEEPFRTSADFEFENNNPPMDVYLTNRIFKENAADSTEIGTFWTVDDQSSDSFEYSLIEGDGDADNGKFVINKDQLLTHHDFRCFERDTFNIRINCTDAAGGEFQKKFKLYLESTETPEPTEIDGYICYGETFSFHGREISTPGIYTDTLHTTLGCDSIVRLLLYQNPYPELITYDTIHCINEDFYLSEFDLPWDSIEKRVTKWTQNSDTLLIFRNTRENTHGCFDTLQLSMHLYPIFHDYHDVATCQNGLPFIYGDSVFSAAGTKDVYFTSKRCGCDSIVTINLTVNPYYFNIPLDTTICSNETFELFGQEFTEPGNYKVYGETAIHHCDSVVNLTLHMKPISENDINFTVCPTDLPTVYENFTIGKNATSGLYYDTLDAKNGCDSIVTLDLTVRDSDTQITDFEGGWYWYSTYLDLTEINGLQSLKDSLGSKGQQIKSQLGPFITYSDGVWTGNLTSINNEQMYMVKTTDTANVDLFSCLTTGYEHPITIKKNWNWIGYVSQYANSTTAALNSISPQEGDIIKSYENGFAVYYEMFGGWFGSLTQMQPGIGYMYYSNNSSDITLTYPVPAKDEGEQFKPLPTHWNTIAGKYPNNMTFIGKITINNIPATTDNLEVGVFCDGEVRGSGRAMLMEGLGTYRLFIQVYGEKGDELTFKLYDHEHNCEFDATCFDKAYFVENANYGTLQDPYAFRFYTQNSGVDENTDMSRELTLFPNPANSNTRVLVYCDFTPEERNGLVIEVYNALGVRIQQIEPTRYPVQLYEIENAGSYTVRVTTGTGRVLSKKLVTTR